MSDPPRRVEVDPLSIQQGDQHGSHDDCSQTKRYAAPALAPDPVPVLQARISECLENEVSGRSRAKQRLEDS